MIHIRTTASNTRPEHGGARPSASSASSAPLASPSISAAKASQPASDVDGRADSRADSKRQGRHRDRPRQLLENQTGTAADGADANCSPQSGPEKSRKKAARAGGHRAPGRRWRHPLAAVLDLLKRHKAGQRAREQRPSASRWAVQRETVAVNADHLKGPLLAKPTRPPKRSPPWRAARPRGPPHFEATRH